MVQWSAAAPVPLAHLFGRSGRGLQKRARVHVFASMASGGSAGLGRWMQHGESDCVKCSRLTLAHQLQISCTAAHLQEMPALVNPH